MNQGPLMLALTGFSSEHNYFNLMIIPVSITSNWAITLDIGRAGFVVHGGSA
jgi:hypothetical protein